MRFTPATWLARKMIRECWGPFTQQRQCRETERNTEVTMSRALKSFADFSLKVVAVRTADDSEFGFEFPASGPQSTPAPLTAPFVQTTERRRDPLEEYPGWHGGGLND